MSGLGLVTQRARLMQGPRAQGLAAEVGTRRPRHLRLSDQPESPGQPVSPSPLDDLVLCHLLGQSFFLLHESQAQWRLGVHTWFLESWERASRQVSKYQSKSSPQTVNMCHRAVQFWGAGRGYPVRVMVLDCQSSCLP